MSFTIGLGSECKVANETLEGPLPIVSSQMPDKGGFISAGVGAQVTLVCGKSKMTSNMTCKISNVRTCTYSCTT